MITLSQARGKLLRSHAASCRCHCRNESGRSRHARTLKLSQTFFSYLPFKSSHGFRGQPCFHVSFFQGQPCFHVSFFQGQPFFSHFLSDQGSSGSFPASSSRKYSFASLKTVPESRKTAIRLGMTIRPLKVSEISQRSPRSRVAPTIEIKA